MSRFDEVKARLRAATPGPWEGHNLTGDTGVICHEDGIVYAGGDILHVVGLKNHDDLRLIANAPADIKYLIEEHCAEQMRRIVAEEFLREWRELAAGIVDALQLSPCGDPECGSRVCEFVRRARALGAHISVKE